MNGYTAIMDKMKNFLAADYNTLEQELLELDAACSAAECHGMVCGQLCRGTQIGAGQWLEHILGRPADTDRGLAARCAQLLEAVLLSAASGLGSVEFGFQPLLPEEGESLARRSMALGQWCEGFLFGFALGGELNADALSAEASESLRDLRDFTRIQVEESMDESEESSYMEVVEYIRVVVVMLFQELQQGHAAEANTRHKGPV